MHHGRNTWIRVRIVALALLLALVTAGCTEDPEPCIPPIYEPPLPAPPRTPDILLSNLKTAYEDMAIDQLTRLLDEDFKMVLAEPTQEMWGGTIGSHFDYTAMVTIHTHMFRGDTGVDVLGNTVHPIGSIEIDLMEQMYGWVAIPPEDEHFGGMDGEYAPIRVTMQFHNANLAHRFLVQQQMYFYIQPNTVDGDTTWKLLGLRGVVAKGTDQVAWDAVCALYR